MKLTSSIRELQKKGIAPVISEVKLRSPRDGDLLRGRDPVDLARRMASLEVAGISIITESKHFGGSKELLADVAKAVDKPVLNKDFIMTKRQIDVSRECGSAAVLLTANIMDDSTLVALHNYSNSLGLETLVEVHTEAELKRVLDLGIDLNILGINNRDITILETDDADVSVTEELAPKIKGDFVILSESSIKTPGEVRRALRGGADCVLIGTAIMQSDNMEIFLGSLINAWNSPE